MTEEMRCSTAVRTKHRKRWFVPLAAALVAAATLLVSGMYDGRSAQAQSTDGGVVAAGDIASCDSRGDERTARLLASSRARSSPPVTMPTRRLPIRVQQMLRS